MSTTTKIPKDNFTRTPNIFFALIRTMSEAELRVMAVAIRKILGWNREKPEPLSKSQFMEWTGMTKKSVTKGINEAIQRGWLILVDCNGERGCARYTLNMDIADWFKPIEETCEEDMDEGDTKYPSQQPKRGM